MLSHFYVANFSVHITHKCLVFTEVDPLDLSFFAASVSWQGPTTKVDTVNIETKRTGQVLLGDPALLSYYYQTDTYTWSSIRKGLF